MELPRRNGEDRFLPSGYYNSLEQRIRDNNKLTQARALIVSAFDKTTRMLPFVHFDWHMVPCGPRSISAALSSSGFENVRMIFQLWSPNVKISKAKLNGAPIDMLLISSMQIHTAPAFKMIEEAWSMGESRPLIIAGGPKACYEPFDYFGLGSNRNIGADIVVTGEEPVLLELLAVLGEFGAGQGTMREAFVRARKAGALKEVPGIVYSESDSYDGLSLVNTGIQRLLRELDNLPMPSEGYKNIEPPHKRETLSDKPVPLKRVCRGNMVATLLITRGCKYHCHYCPIPSYNQGSLRFKSPERLIAEFIDCNEKMGTRNFFGADDNFFNRRHYVEKVFQLMADTRLHGKPLRRSVRFFTEATVIDLYKNRDLFPLAKKAGFASVWIGVEDLSATLVNKGQNPKITKELFAEMLKYRISPMVMMMHSENQPLYSPGKLDGLINQIHFLREVGAVSLQCTVASPAVGSKWISEVFANKMLFKKVGKIEVADCFFDGNHVIASMRPDAWRTQVNMLRGYAAFYNPVNMCKALLCRNNHIARKKIYWQAWGMIAWLRTAWYLKGYIWNLWKGPIERWQDWPDKFKRSGSPYPGLIVERRTKRKEDVGDADIGNKSDEQDSDSEIGKKLFKQSKIILPRNSKTQKDKQFSY